MIEADYEPNPLWDLDYDSSVAMRYHAKRRAFLETLDRLDPALTVLFGSTAFAAIVTTYATVAAWAAGAAVLVSAVNLAFGVGERARLHDSLYRRWADLRVQLVEMDADDKSIKRLQIIREKIDADTPAQLRVLTIVCDDTERDVRRLPGKSHVRWWQRRFQNWVDLPPWEMEDSKPAKG